MVKRYSHTYVLPYVFCHRCLTFSDLLMVVSTFLLVVIIIVLAASSFFIITVSSFESSTTTNNNGRFSRISKQLSRRHRAFVLGGTIKFVGNASARLSIPSPIIINNVDNSNDKENKKSLSNFLTTPASDTVLLGKTSTCTRIEDGTSTNTNQGGGEELWECRQASVAFFGLQISPVFTNRLERSTNKNEVTITLLDSRSEVEGGRLGNTLASVMKKSKFEGRNTITWQENYDAMLPQQDDILLEGKLNLTLTITLPPFLPLPPGFNAIGSKIVERTCAERLKQNLNEVSDAYRLWTLEEHHHQ